MYWKLCFVGKTDDCGIPLIIISYSFNDDCKIKLSFRTFHNSIHNLILTLNTMNAGD